MSKWMGGFRRSWKDQCNKVLPDHPVVFRMGNNLKPDQFSGHKSYMMIEEIALDAFCFLKNDAKCEESINTVSCAGVCLNPSNCLDSISQLMSHRSSFSKEKQLETFRNQSWVESKTKVAKDLNQPYVSCRRFSSRNALPPFPKKVQEKKIYIECSLRS